MSFMLAAAISLVPVSADDPLLDLKETFVSDVAKAAAVNDGASPIFCLNLDRPRRGIANVCLTQTEWQRVDEAAKKNATREWSHRVARDSEFRAGRSYNGSPVGLSSLRR